LKPPIVTGDCWAVMRYVCAYCGREAALAELEHSCPGCAAKRWEPKATVANAAAQSICDRFAEAYKGLRHAHSVPLW
jgi:hypothetical protein